MNDPVLAQILGMASDAARDSAAACAGIDALNDRLTEHTRQDEVNFADIREGQGELETAVQALQTAKEVAEAAGSVAGSRAGKIGGLSMAAIFIGAMEVVRYAWGYFN